MEGKANFDYYFYHKIYLICERRIKWNYESNADENAHKELTYVSYIFRWDDDDEEDKISKENRGLFSKIKDCDDKKIDKKRTRILLWKINKNKKWEK